MHNADLGQDLYREKQKELKLDPQMIERLYVANAASDHNDEVGVVSSINPLQNRYNSDS